MNQKGSKHEHFRGFGIMDNAKDAYCLIFINKTKVSYEKLKCHC